MMPDMLVRIVLRNIVHKQYFLRLVDITAGLTRSPAQLYSFIQYNIHIRIGPDFVSNYVQTQVLLNDIHTIEN